MFFYKNKILISTFFLIGTTITFLLLGSDHFSLSGYLYSENYDLMSDQLAFKFFINDDWHFPIGKNPNYGMGVGNSIVFSGAVPILAFLIKPIVNFLPANFQFLSIWLVCCFTLQLIFSYLIIFNFTKNNFYSFVSSLLFIFSPILLYRVPINISLVAHWLILACFYFEIQNFNKEKTFFYSLILSIALLIHFYFVPMILIIQYSFLIYEYYLIREIKIKLKEVLIPLLCIFCTAYVSGYFEISVFDAMGYGFGYYSFNLSGLFDSQSSQNGIDWSLFLSDISNTKGQAEGFSYLGIGGLITLIFLFINFFSKKNKIKKQRFPFFFIIFICFILAISNVIYLGSFLLFEYQLPKIIYGLLSIIRASGRFIWLIYYLILIFGIVSIYELYNSKKAKLIISIIFILQLLDISPALEHYYNAKAFNVIKINSKSETFWSNISDRFPKIRTTYYKNTSNIFPAVSHQILKNNFLQTDVVRLGRYDRTKASKNRNQLYFELNNKILDDKTLYVIDNENHLRYLKYLYQNEDIGFFFVDNIWLMAKGHKSNMSNEDYINFNKIKPIQIKENVKHFFDSSDTKNALGFGWSFSFRKGIWTEGNELNILFAFQPNEKKEYNVRLKISSSIADINKYLFGSVKFNGKKIKNFKFKNFENSSDTFIEFLIPITDINNELYKVDIIVDNPISPLSLLRSADGRMLGILIESIEII